MAVNGTTSVTGVLIPGFWGSPGVDESPLQPKYVPRVWTRWKNVKGERKPTQVITEDAEQCVDFMLGKQGSRMRFPPGPDVPDEGMMVEWAYRWLGARRKGLTNKGIVIRDFVSEGRDEESAEKIVEEAISTLVDALITIYGSAAAGLAVKKAELLGDITLRMGIAAAKAGQKEAPKYFEVSIKALAVAAKMQGIIEPGSTTVHNILAVDRSTQHQVVFNAESREALAAFELARMRAATGDESGGIRQFSIEGKVQGSASLGDVESQDDGGGGGGNHSPGDVHAAATWQERVPIEVLPGVVSGDVS